MSHYIIISKGTELLRIPPDRLVYISADGNYSDVHMLDGRSQMVSFQLGQLEDLIGDQLGDDGGRFVRLGRGYIINMDYVFLIDIAKKRLVLSDCMSYYQELEPSREVLVKLKAYMDATLNND
ncbi:MAG: LytTR family transcriptional regulator [Bacteroidales bacterium]|nr:LytTR family transcriptional regulator [Bacteroidales bacterium]